MQAMAFINGVILGSLLNILASIFFSMKLNSDLLGSYDDEIK